MSEVVGRMQERIRSSSSEVSLFLLKIITGLVLGLTFALIVHEVMGTAEGEGQFSFFFILVAFTAAFWRVAKKWSWATVLIFDLVCVLVGIILRLYIMVAPGA